MVLEKTLESPLDCKELQSVWIFFYSTNPLLVETEPEKARKLLKQNGFILDGKANDVSVDRPTHTGAFFTVFKFENYNNEESEVLNNG